MVEANDNTCSWTELVVTGLGGSIIKKQWVHTNDCETKDRWRQKYKDKNLFFSAAGFDSPEKSAKCTASLYFVLRSNSLEDVREAAIKTCLYISESFGIPPECIEVIYIAGGNMSDVGGGNGSDASAAAATDNASDSGENSLNSDHTAAEIVILTPHIVFAGQPTPLMPLINYDLARQLVKDGIENIDIDVYYRNYLIRLPNSYNFETSSHVIPLSANKELLYLDAPAIAELSKQPRPEDSLIIPQTAPEAVEWFSGLLKETEKEQEWLQRLRELLFEDGWQIPPCFRRLLWADLSKSQALEACRVVSQFYFWLGASSGEAWQHLQQIDRRNRIDDYSRLKSIVSFATENPKFAGCEHPMLQRFCPAGKCFMVELIGKIERPYLFELGGY